MEPRKLSYMDNVNMLPLMAEQERKEFEAFIGSPLTNDEAQLLRHDIAVWKMFDEWIADKDKQSLALDVLREERRRS